MDFHETGIKSYITKIVVQNVTLKDLKAPYFCVSFISALKDSYNTYKHNHTRPLTVKTIT